MDQFFSDIKVIELASVLAGPSVGVFFAELGAEVIKIENPKTGGDVTRTWKLPNEKKEDPSSAYYCSVNSGKKIFSIDISDPAGLTQFYSLIKDADIVIGNFKAGDDSKLKVDYNSLKKINPQIIYASINGFGNESNRVAYDLILQAEAGFMMINGELNSSPVKLPIALIDVIAGHQLKEAILMALLKREKKKTGSHISVSLFDSAIASLVNQATNWLIAGEIPQAKGSLHPNIAPYGELFKTSDDHVITFAIGSDKQFQNLCTLLNTTSLIEDQRFSSNQDRVKNRNELFALLKEAVSKLSFDELYKKCSERAVPIGKLRNMKEVFELPESKQMLKTFNFEGQEKTVVRSVAFKFLD